MTALVMELVEGPTLADRIAPGPIPLDEALPIARQIADALQAAHEKGIIHRDLKPANIAFTADDQVKVLDFVLAKALERPAAGRCVECTDDRRWRGTQVGVILGTAAYMAPEQAKGKAADKRSDVWGLGCVLFEMLTGRRAFERENVSDTLAAVLRGEPDWTLLPDDLPPAIRTLLHRCLQKRSHAAARGHLDCALLVDRARGLRSYRRSSNSSAPALQAACPCAGGLVACGRPCSRDNRLVGYASTRTVSAARVALTHHAAKRRGVEHQFHYSQCRDYIGRDARHLQRRQWHGARRAGARPAGRDVVDRSRHTIRPVRVARRPVDRLCRRDRAKEGGDHRRPGDDAGQS